MKTLPRIPVLLIVVVLLLLVSVPNTTARPRPPIIPFPELTLKSWKFDYPSRVTAEYMGALIATNLLLTESWSGYALFMPDEEHRLLLTPTVSSNGRAIFSPGNGTLRLWYAPNWASTSAGGTGPGQWAIFFDLFQTNALTNLFGTITTITNPFRLVLAVDPAGTNLVAAVETATGASVLVSHPISWTTGQWHQIGFSYWSNGVAGVALVVDDQPEQVAYNVPAWPSSSVWNQSAFSLAGGFNGKHLAQGQLDEIHTFGYALSTNYLTWSYELFSPIAALGPLPDEEGGFGTLSDDPPAPCESCEGGEDNFVPGPPGFCETNGLRFAATPYRTNATNLATMLLDTNSSSRAYQIFQTLQLQSIPSNTLWTLAANGAIGVTNFNLSFSTNTTNASFLAARITDADGDGFSDSYESLILKSNPNQFNDTNSDGIGDHQFVLEWDMQTLDAGPAQGVVLSGNGFHVTADNLAKLMGVSFDQRYRGYPLKNFPGDASYGVFFTNLVDSTLTHYKVIYDLQRARVFRNGQPLILYNGRPNTIPGNTTTNVQWLDNMTDAVGTNGPLNLDVSGSNMQVSNVTAQAPQFSNPSRYTYMGNIGNTSSNFYGPNMHAAFQAIKFMLVHTNGTDGFYSTVYNEGGTALQKFNPAQPQAVITSFGPTTDLNSGVRSELITNMTIQGNTLYVAGNPFTHKFRVPIINDNLITTTNEDFGHTNGAPHHQSAPSEENEVFRVTVTSTGTLPGNLAAGVVYYVNVHNQPTNLTLHTTAAGAFNNTNPRNMSSRGNGTHTMHFRGRVQKFDVATTASQGFDTNFPATPVPFVPLNNRVTYVVNPHATNTVAVYYTNDTVVVYTNAYSAGWGTNFVIGVAGGYANGPSILIPSTNSSYRTQLKLGSVWYDDGVRKTNVALAFQPDGKLWVGDTVTSRMLRFVPGDGCDTWFMFVPHTYCASADPNNPQRVFNEYLEFRVDYNTLTQTGGWVLTNYWGFGVSRPGPGSHENGLFNVTTVSNRAYALIFDPAVAVDNCQNGRRIAELTGSGLRATSVSNLSCQYYLQPDGALHRISDTNFIRQVITNIAVSGDPLYGAATTIATVTNTGILGCDTFDFKVAGNKLIVFNHGLSCSGNHLGAASYASNSVWLWQAMPTGPLNGRGQFDPEANTGGADLVVVDDNIFALYNGEFWHNAGQANQVFHYKTDGTFVGQFGMPATADTMKHAIGSAGNMFTLSYVKTNGVIHLFTNNEHGTGTQVWRIEP